MEKIEFNNYAPPGISKEILEQLQENVEEAIKTQVKKVLLLNNPEGALTGSVLSENVDNYDLIIATIGNVNNAKERQNVILPVCAGIYTHFFYLYASSAYNASILVNLENKTQIDMGIRNPVGWAITDIRAFKVLGIKF